MTILKEISKLPQMDSTEIVEFEMVESLEDYLSRIDRIKDNKLIKSCQCGFNWLPIGDKFASKCPKCGGNCE